MTQEVTPAYDMSIHHNPDAQAWAKFYCETFPDADEALMVGWFSNAMMAMHDWQVQKHELTLTAAQSEADDLRKRVDLLEAHVRGLIQLALDGGLTHDLIAQIYPDSKKPNRQPALEFAKRAQRAINEARQALAGQP